MPTKKILLLYISQNSGHFMAALSVEKALKALDKNVVTLGINSVNYTNPIAERVVNKTYMSIIKTRPEVWDYLYDNPKILKSVKRLRNFIHHINLNKLKALIDSFSPSVVICTQAFPCGMIADLKKRFNLEMPLIGVLTDHIAHAYWIFDNVDYYVVPSVETGKRLIDEGIQEEKIKSFGIPISPDFLKKTEKYEICKKYGLNPDKPTILLMGGGQGLGPIKKVAALLEKSCIDLQIIVVTGTNKKLYRWIKAKAGSFRKKIISFEYANNINELMEVSALIITKPGGLTTSEAMVKRLPMIILKPIPGQEQKNTDYLKKIGVAVRALDEEDAVILAEDLLNNPGKLEQMRNQTIAYGKPDSAFDIARLALELCSKNEILPSIQNRAIPGSAVSG